MDCRKIGCEDWRWTELAQNCVHRLALVVEVLNILVLLPLLVVSTRCIIIYSFCSVNVIVNSVLMALK
jgi:hypothetical protein